VFECVITVPGGNDSPSKDGQPVRGPVESFFKNYSKCYTAVQDHVLECPHCCPEEALRRFLAARDRPNLGGFTSPGLLKMAFDMERAIKRGRCFRKKTLSKEIVKEYVIRMGMPSVLVMNAHRFGDVELVKALHWVWRRWEFNRIKYGNPSLINMSVEAALQEVRKSENGIGCSPERIMTASRGRLIYWMTVSLGETFKVGDPFPDLDLDLEDFATVVSVMCS